MGNSQSESELEVFKLKYSSLKPISNIKNGFGNLLILEDTKKNKYIEKQIFYDSEKNLLKIRKALIQIENSKKINYLKAFSIFHNSQKYFCTVSNIKIVFEYFENTLQDILKKRNLVNTKKINSNKNNFYLKNLKNENYEFKEYQIWRLIFSICKILRFNKLHKIKNNFIHLKSIYYRKKKNDFGLIHSSYFKENNFILAISHKTHFCSPELFCQILSKDHTFFLQNENKSNIFSLGIIILKLLTNFKNEEIYDLNLLQIKINFLHQITNDLENKNFSKILIRVINDMIQDLEHIRITPSKLLKILENHENDLKNENFKNYDMVLNNYINFKAKQDDLSLEFKLEEIYADPENGEKGHYLQNQMQPGLYNDLNQKTVPFEYNFMDSDIKY